MEGYYIPADERLSLSLHLGLLNIIVGLLAYLLLTTQRGWVFFFISLMDGMNFALRFGDDIVHLLTREISRLKRFIKRLGP
jgi:hypothetical protein